MKIDASDESMATTALTPVRVNPVLQHPLERRHSLSGQWRFRLDPDDRGVNERWFSDAKPMAEPIQVPGCWQGQGFGTDAKNDIMEGRDPLHQRQRQLAPAGRRLGTRQLIEPGM